MWRGVTLGVEMQIFDRISNPGLVAMKIELFQYKMSLTAGKGGTNVRKWIKVAWTLTSMERIKIAGQT